MSPTASAPKRQAASASSGRDNPQIFTRVRPAARAGSGVGAPPAAGSAGAGLSISFEVKTDELHALHVDGRNI
jgi:hypothetical protein